MDCMEGMRQIPDKFFELAIVDPPYGINISNNIGRRKKDRHSNYKKIDWDKNGPQEDYFEELKRVSKNQIIFGANHFYDKIKMKSSCWIIWDKKFSDNVSFASFEMALTSFDVPCKRISLSSVQQGRIHPTQKPVELYEWLLSKFAKQGDKILDTHVGSASSLIACHRMGFDFMGFELDKEYYKTSSARLEQEMAQTNMFTEGR